MLHKIYHSSVSVFYSYSYEDEWLRELLEKHLILLKREELIIDWYNRKIIPGTDWAQAIDEHINTASFILLLVSPDFLNSDYCYNIEMRRALERHKLGEVRIIPIVLRPCEWERAAFAHLEVLPRNGKAITEWENLDKAFLEIVQDLRQAIEDLNDLYHLTPSHSKLDVDWRNRMNFLGNIYETWITKFLLEKSLQHAAWIELGLEERGDFLLNPWRYQVQEMQEQVPHTLPTGTTIEQVYNQAREGQLLIVGEPGSGKTTQLLQLARSLIERAQQDKQQLIPVIFMLSSWAQKRLSLADWLIEELRMKYEVPRSIGQVLIRDGHILPLLDGLDEVKVQARSACVEAINSYLEKQLNQVKKVAPLIICCRSKEYRDLLPRLVVQHAVGILPLSDDQIDSYFQRGGPAVEVLGQVVREDDELLALARQPLMLSVFILAYQGSDQQKAPVGKTREETLRIVWNAYIHRMLHRRGSLSQWTEPQVRNWLTMLAQQMHQRNQTIFQVENLQGDWLPKRSRHLFPWCMGMFVGIIVAVLVGVPFGILRGLLFGIAFGILGGIVVKTQKITPSEKLGWTWKKFRISMLGGGLFGVVFGVLGGLLFGSSINGTLGGILGGVAFGMLNGVEKAQIIERKVLHPNAGIQRSGVSGVIVGVLSGVIVTLVVGTLGDMAFGILSGVVFGMLSGMEKALRPNAGIQRSGISGAIVIMLSSVIFGVFGGVVGGVFFGVLLTIVKGMAGGVLNGIVFGVFFGVLDGGDAFVQHYFLRIFLWLSGLFPLRLVSFLDKMEDRLLLRRIGGSYIFAHRSLLEHFANEYAGTIKAGKAYESDN